MAERRHRRCDAAHNRSETFERASERVKRNGAGDTPPAFGFRAGSDMGSCIAPLSRVLNRGIREIND
jgi:hypothetical protein